MAKGSNATLAGYPNRCAVCGKPVVVSGNRPLWFETTRAGRRSYHHDCYRKKQEPAEAGSSHASSG